MRREYEHQPNSEPLPAERFDRDLRSIDSRLGRLAMARMDRVPDGLEDRLHRASVEAMPGGRRLTAAQPAWRPRLAGTTRRVRKTSRDWRLVATGWGRLGLAAALGVAFVFAALLNDQPAAPATGEVASLDMRWLEEDPLDYVDEQVAHILDTSSLSFDDVTGEIESMLASLEM